MLWIIIIIFYELMSDNHANRVEIYYLIINIYIKQ
ncbi:uncharacterized protein METZ01_LOCUS349976 [marine metagenome]|uniref:Uncharacterized protein n=1 Tax=marine metagenome TaxID=408172 RepID=A0A382RIS0_9ZZZZ